jgi:hypothetical protein
VQIQLGREGEGWKTEERAEPECLAFSNAEMGMVGKVRFQSFFSVCCNAAEISKC